MELKSLKCPINLGFLPVAERYIRFKNRSPVPVSIFLADQRDFIAIFSTIELNSLRSKHIMDPN